MFLAQCLWCRSACQAGRIIGKPVRGRRCPRNGKECLAAASGHWERPREGAAVGNSHPPSPETSPERRTAFGSRVAITEPCEAVCSRGLSGASPSPDITSDHATTGPTPNVRADDRRDGMDATFYAEHLLAARRDRKSTRLNSSH